MKYFYFFALSSFYFSLAFMKHLNVEIPVIFNNKTIFYGKTHFRRLARFYKNVHFKKNVIVDGVMTFKDVVIDNLHVNGCISSLCVENLSIMPGNNNIYINENSINPLDESNTIRIGNTQTRCFIKQDLRII